MTSSSLYYILFKITDNISRHLCYILGVINWFTLIKIFYGMKSKGLLAYSLLQQNVITNAEIKPSPCPLRP